VPPLVAARVPVVSAIAIPRVEVAAAETVLSALMRRKVWAPGFASVKMLPPTVVAPSEVLAVAPLSYAKVPAPVETIN